MKEKYFLGLDVGTNSVGYAVTDLRYNVLKFNKKAMWGVHVFDEGKQAAERRTFRSNRRRLQRKKQRTELLQREFAKEIYKVDPNFYLKLKESDLYLEDRTLGNKYTLFDDEDFNDKTYNEKFPTIHHLIMHLIKTEKKEDIRLIYLAVNYLIKNRGHFLFQVDKDNINEIMSFDRVFNKFKDALYDLAYEDNFSSNYEMKLKEILSQKAKITTKQEAIKKLFFSNAKPSKIDMAIIKAISGGTFSLKDIFENEAYDGLEIKKIQLSKDGVDDTLKLLSHDIDDFELNLLQSLKLIYDWSVLNDILKGKEYISEGKVMIYKQHKEDLKWLKSFVKKYTPKKYNEIFKDLNHDNYVSYSKNVSGLTKKEYLEHKNSDYETFAKYLKNILKEIRVEKADEKKYKDFLERIEIENDFLPKQKTKNNSSIPYQLNSYQLKKLLENQAKHYPFLLEKDDSGLTSIEKILSIIEFRIPYYVGPINDNHDKSWIIKKRNEKILPWNLKDIVDLEKSEEAFIRRMTNKCSYLLGEDVLAKHSLLYSKFAVLNEINNIKVKGIPISPECKIELFNDLYQTKYNRVTKKKIYDWLISNGKLEKNNELSVKNDITGVDDPLISSLKSYHDFKEYIDEAKLTNDDVEEIIARITLTTDKIRLRKYLTNNYPKLNKEDIHKIANLNYSGFGRLSKKLLTGIVAINKITGSEENIIDSMFHTNANLMELLSKEYDYINVIEQYQKDYYEENPKNVDGMLEDMYISNAVKRPIFRGIAIAKEIKSIMKEDPKKIFVEMAKGKEEKPKRKNSRKESLKEIYKNCDQDIRKIWTSKLENESNDRLKSERYFLYYSQLGKCMYCNKGIELDLLSSNQYDIDHIYPRSKTKDESVHNNKVLVCTKCNQDKKDEFPIKSQIQNQMNSTWKYLEKTKLMTSEKLYRLTRVTYFSEKELSDFISRQLVETRQSTKALAKILEEIFPNSEIVYVKADLTSDFRQQYELPKVRILNDFHHAKDAYLNIVIGNVYDVKFTKNILHFIQSKERYSVNIKQKGGLLSNDIIRGSEIAWIRKNDETITNVKKQYYKNNINHVRYTFMRKGGLFDQNLLKAGQSVTLIPKKLDKDINKYGGYNKSTASFFSLVKHLHKENEIISIIPIDLLYKNIFLSSEESALEYCEKQLNLKSPSSVADKKILKVNTLISLDGFRVNLGAKNSGSYTVYSAMSLILTPNQEKYLKRIESIINKSKRNKIELRINEEYDKITRQENIDLYKILENKSSSIPFNKLSVFRSLSILMNKSEQLFIDLSIENQVKALHNIINVFKEGRGSRVDLTLIGGIKNGSAITIPGILSGDTYKKIEFIDQSPTGLFEKSTGNILKNEL